MVYNNKTVIFSQKILFTTNTMKQNTAPTIQVTASGKVVVTNAKDIDIIR